MLNLSPRLCYSLRPMYLYNDSFMLPIFLALGFSFWAQWKVKSTYERYAKVNAKAGISGAEVAEKILNRQGIGSVPVRETPGELTDHYDPLKKTLNLSSAIYRSGSIAAYGIAAHEAGHAIQHNKAYWPLAFRNSFFPAANLGSNFAVPLFIAGMFFSLPFLMDLGIIFFAFAVVFSFVTLPVEFDASNRAITLLRQDKFLSTAELKGAQEVLSAAALTYVAATAMAVLQLLRLLAMRNSRD